MNTDCPPAAPNCVFGVCAQCVRSRDCPAGQACVLGTCR
jgi:Cys-rich repeat protein